jgi:hypothetical protein
MGDWLTAPDDHSRRNRLPFGLPALIAERTFSAEPEAVTEQRALQAKAALLSDVSIYRHVTDPDDVFRLALDHERTRRHLARWNAEAYPQQRL